MAKEFLIKGRTIYTKNPKDIIPIVKCPSSPPGIKDPPQFATTDDVTETSPSASPPGIKDPPRIATIVQKDQFSKIGEDSTPTMLTNISTESENTTFIEDHKVMQ